MGGLPEDQLAEQLGVGEGEIRDDIRALVGLGYIEHQPAHRSQRSGSSGLLAHPPGSTISHDPIRDADTNPGIWLHARDLYEPRAASQCYPHVFAILLGDLEDTGATVEQLTEVMPDDDWFEFLMCHIGIIKCEPGGALSFFVTEIIEQMLRRINERYPVTKGYSPVHIALVTVYRAVRAAHDEVLNEAGAC